ncbi:MAG: DNA topoisomerase I, partial [Moorea sp. SIO2B7]|nr:DNA topoisomerase I [Moorena sp. SIO2B7]
AFAVTNLLEQNFPDLVDTSFTAKMERTLDDIANGAAQWLPYLQNFYLGEKGLDNQVKERINEIDPIVARTVELEDLDARVRIGKFGPYVEVNNGNGVLTASIPQDLTPAELNIEQVQVLIQQKMEGPEKLGLHPETGEPIYILNGNYGPYLQLGDATEDKKKKPKRVSLPKGVNKEDVHLEMAVGLLALPRLLGPHPETGKPVKTAIGRFGPYVVHDQGKEGKDYRSLKAEDNVLTITLDRALELLAQPKRTRGGSRSKTKKPLRELGAHPQDGEPVNIYQGPYGIYVNHGKVNASLPEGTSMEELTLETALELIAAKASSGKSGRKSSKSTTSTKKKTSGKSTKKTTKTTKDDDQEAQLESE